MLVQDLGLLPYRDAWSLQERVHREVADGAEERLLLVEHPPVITFGRRPNVHRNLVASDEELVSRGVEVVQSDRGGDITFHGPGQLVAYPIARLIDHKLSVGGFVRRLEEIVIAALRDLGVAGQKDACAIGVWAPVTHLNGQSSKGESERHLAKICALGVRIRRGVSMHGIALNVATDLRYFDLIVPCGLAGRAVTSIQTLRGTAAPTMNEVKAALAKQFLQRFG